MHFTYIFFTVQVIGYGLCDRKKYKYAGNVANAQIKPTATRSILVDGEQKPVTVGGIITVEDGCSVIFPLN
jgi:hypothetical protein